MHCIRKIGLAFLVLALALGVVSFPVQMATYDTKTTTQKQVKKWFNEGPMYQTGVTYFPGKTIKEIIKSIPYLKDLGVQTIYVLPIWTHREQYLYSIFDYYSIDPAFGNESDLHNLVDVVHKNGMKILLDLVTNNTTHDSVIYSKYSHWILSNEGWPHKWGPVIDRANPEVQKYFAEVAKYYVEKYDIDGWRVDAPQNNYNPREVSGNHNAIEFFRKIKQEITSVKPDAILYGEWYGTKTDWGEYTDQSDTDLDEAFDFSQGWLFRRWILEAIKDGKKTSQDLIEFLKMNRSNIIE